MNRINSLKQIRTGVVLFLLVINLQMLAMAQQGGTARYFYDANGRLSRVLSPTGEAAIYNYDPAGNFTSIQRLGPNDLSIFEFTPATGAAGTTVTIVGTGFLDTIAGNTVRFNGTTATVTAATKTQLTVTVPSGATTGPISITNTNGTVNSAGNFFIASGNLEFDQPINFGESVSFEFAYTIGQPTPLTSVGALRFEGVQGQRMALLVENSACAGGFSQPQAQISLISPTGAIVATTPYQDYSFPGFTVPGFAYMDTLVLPATGRYTILIDPTDGFFPLQCGGQLRNFNGAARLYDVPPDSTGTIQPTGFAQPNTTAPGQNARLTFNGATGQRLSLDVVQECDCTTAFATNIAILKPDGTNLTTNTLNSRRFIEPFTLPSNGAYTILLDQQINKAQPHSVYLADIPADVSGTVVIGGATVRVAIPIPGQVANLAFNVPSSQTVTINLTNALYDTHISGAPLASCVVSVINASGTTVFTANVNVSFIGLQTPALAAGNYTLRIDPAGAGNGTMDVRLSTP